MCIRDRLNKFGLSTKVVVKEWGTLYKQCADVHDYDMTQWHHSGREDRVDPNAFLYGLFHSSGDVPGGTNYVGYRSEEYDKVCDAQVQELDKDKRRELVYKCQSILAEDKPMDWLLHWYTIDAYNNKKCKGWVQTPLGLHNIWSFINVEAEEGTLIGCWTEDLDNLNPVGTERWKELAQFELIYDRLGVIDEKGLPKPWAAKKWEVVDNVTVDVYLRDDLVFHDGVPVKPEDVKFTFDYCKEMKIPRFYPYAKEIDYIEVDGDRITFHMVRPYAPLFVQLFCFFYILPKHIWEKRKEAPWNLPIEKPIGSGPFRVEYWEKGEEISLVKWDQHFAKPKIDRRIWRIITSPEMRITMLEKGEIHYVPPMAISMGPIVKKLEENPDITVVKTMEFGFTTFHWNNRREPFSDKAFRQALSHLLPREEIASEIFYGYAIPGKSPISPVLEFWHNPNVRVYPYDPDAAEKILREAGYTRDEKGRWLKPA